MKLRVAVIGTGNMGIHHLRNYYHHKSVEVIGVVDINEEHITKVRQHYPVKGYRDYKDLIDLVDAVSIATPTSTHYELAKFFLERGIHVLLEKPVTQNTFEALELINLADHKGVVLAIGHIERFNPVMKEMKRIIDGQKPTFIDIHRESPFDPRIFDTDVVCDLMIHDIDLLGYVLKEELEVLSAYGVAVHSDKNDIVNAQLKSKSGVLINVMTSRATEQKIRSWRVLLPDSLVEADLLERKLHVTRRTSVNMNVLPANSEHKYTQEQLTAKILVGNYEPLQMEIDDFIQAIHTGGTPKVGGNDGLEALKMVNKVRETISLRNLDKFIILEERQHAVHSGSKATN